MKKTVSLLAILMCFVFSNKINAQAFGMSASLAGFFPKYQDVTTNPYYGNSRVLGHTGAFSPGIRLEANYILPGFNFPVGGYNGLDFTYFFPVVDSTYYTAFMKNGSQVGVIGTSKTTSYQISLRCGYEIPQTFNDFLLLHFGWGMGFMHSKSVPVIPDRTTTFPYDQSDFEASTFTPTKQGEISIEILAGGIYEFERFSVMAQYSVIFGLGEEGLTPNSHYRHGLTVGIFYPLKKL
jgi:hypothetical protein